MDSTEKKPEQIVINFRLPKDVKEELENYAKIKGVTMSYVLRHLVEVQILKGDLPLQYELWEILLAWMKDIETWTTQIDEWRKHIMQMLGEQLEVTKDVNKHTWENRDEIKKLSKGTIKMIESTIKALEVRPTNKQVEDLLVRVLTRIEKERHK